MADQNISQLVQDLFPAFYQEEGPLFIQFVKAYYEWMEQLNGPLDRIDKLTDYFDIDRTSDEFIEHFKQQYLPAIQFTNDTDRRLVLKHAREFLSTKGTEESVALLMKLVYNQPASVVRPNDRVLRASHGVFYIPRYLELSPSEKAQTFVGKEVVGSRSGARAIAERVARKTIRGFPVDVLYISNVQGNFLYKEIITADGLLDDCPFVVGSMTSIDVTSGGKDFNVGDELTVNSSISGKSGLARVTDVGTATGRVTFTLEDGGFGFTNSSIVLVSDQVLNLSAKTPNPAANASYKDFVTLERIVQPMQLVECASLSANLTIDTLVRGYDGSTVVASGYVVGSPAEFTANNQTIKVIVESGSFSLASDIKTTANAIVGIVASVTNAHATGVMVGTSNTDIGVANTNGAFTANSTHAFIYGAVSNTYANVSSMATGSGAGFDIGVLSNTEEVFLNTDRLAANNVFEVPFMQVPLNDPSYGFVKDPGADLNTVLINALTRGVFQLGTISSLTNISLGAGYNRDPYVLVLEPGIAGFGRRDVIVTHDNTTATFLEGEAVVQTFETPRTIISYTDKNIYDFQVGELVIQGSARAVISQVQASSSTTGSFYIQDISGTFDPDNGAIVGQTSGASATVSDVTTSQAISTVRGVVKASYPGVVILGRRSFNLSFTPGIEIVGTTSGVTANVLSVANDETSDPIGMNARVTAAAGAVAGFIKSVEVVDSGFAYKDFEPIELKREDNPFVATGNVRLLNQGEGKGYFTSERGFLNYTYNYLHDNDYWQEYSYEVRTGIALSRYKDMLMEACHVAGTKLFGAIEKISELSVTEQLSAIGFLSMGDTSLYVSEGTGAFQDGELLSSNGTIIGFVGEPVQSDLYASGFVDVVSNSTFYSPSISASTTSGTIHTRTYLGTTANTTNIVLRDVEGSLMPSFGVGEIYTNTNIVYTSPTAVVGDRVYQVAASEIAAVASGSGTLLQTARATTATYRTSTGTIATAAANVLRPAYNANNSIEGILVEKAATNKIIYSSAFSNWTQLRTSVISDDVLDLLGNQQADMIKDTAEAGTHEVSVSDIAVTSGTQYTFSCFLKASTLNFAALTLNAKFGVLQSVAIDLTTGATSVIGGTPTVVVEQFADGWFRLSITATATSSGAATASVRLAASLSSTTFTGTGAQSIWAFGAQLEEGAQSTSYIPTSGGIITRAADTVSPTAAGWKNINTAGVVRTASLSHVAIMPMTRVQFGLRSNTGVFPVGAVVAQGQPVVAEGTVVFSNTTSIVVTTDVGNFFRYGGNLYLTSNTDVYVKPTDISRTAGVANSGYLVAQASNTSVVVGAGLNSDIELDTATVLFGNALNSLKVSDYVGQVAPGTIVTGLSSNSSANVQFIER